MTSAEAKTLLPPFLDFVETLQRDEKSKAQTLIGRLFWVPACAEKEKTGQKITPPGLPLPPEDHPAFITEDCIEAPQL